MCAAVSINRARKCWSIQAAEDETDRRRAFITLTDKAEDTMARYFTEVGSQASQLA